MTDKELIDGLVHMEEQAQEMGLCAVPFMLVRVAIAQRIRERDIAEKRYNKAVELLTDLVPDAPCGYILDGVNVDEVMSEDGWCDENCDSDYEKCWRRYLALATDTMTEEET